MMEEIVPQTFSFMRSFDQARHIGNDEAGLYIQPYHPQIGRKGGKGIRRGFGAGGGNLGNQGGFAGIGQTHDTDIGEQTQLQQQLSALPGLPQFRKAGGAASGGGEMNITPASPASFGGKKSLPRLLEVGEQCAILGPSNHGANRNLNDNIFSEGAKTLFALPGLAGRSFVLAFDDAINQGTKGGFGAEINAAPPAPVSPIGAASGNILLPTKSKRAVPAVSGLD